MKRLDKLRDKMAREQGDRHATPIIRSMYPLTSRGEMASQFAQLYSLGFDAAVSELMKVIKVQREALQIIGDELAYEGDYMENIARNALAEVDKLLEGEG